MEQIFKDLLLAPKAEEVRKILVKIGKSKMRWDVVGNRKNNLATINIGADPASGVTERITNVIDAVLEKELKIKNEPTDRIVILSDVNPFEENDRLNGQSILNYERIKESTQHFLG